MSELAPQLVAAVIAGLVLLVVQPNWMRNALAVTASEAAPTGNHSDSGAQAASSDSQIMGAVYADQSPHTTIRANIEESPNASASDDDYGKVVLLLVTMGIAASLFVLLRPLLQAVSYGAIVSTVVMALVAVYRTHTLKVWTVRAVTTVVVVVGAVVVSVLTWRASGSLARGGMSLDALREAMPAYSGDPDAGALANLFDHLVNNLLPSFFGFHEHVLVFVLSLLVAAVAQSALCFVALSAVWDWNAFLSFSAGRSRKKHRVAQARSHQEGGALVPLLGAALLSAVALLSAHGVSYDFVLGLVSG